MIKKLLTLGLIICFLAQSSLAVLRSPDGISPRALGMGQAFTAIADDAFAAYWNPAGFAINPGVDIATNYQLTNRNQSIGDNAFALKGCFEIGMNPFAWVAGIGLATMFAYEGAKYLSDKGVVKKGWGRPGTTVDKTESMAEGVKAEDDKKIAEGKEPVRKPISRKKAAKKAAKEAAKGTIHVTKKFAKAALRGAARQTRHYYYAPHWHRPNYYRPTYWDNRYDYEVVELTPANKAQFAVGLTVMSDQNLTLNQDTNWYSFSGASGYGETVAFGANLNIYDVRIPSLNVKGIGAGLDLGALLRISDALMFGLTAKEILTTDVHFNNNSVQRYQMKVNLGAAIKPIRQLTLAADIHNVFDQGGETATMHYGFEVRPIYGVAFRGGLSDNNKTAGISVGIEQLIIDYTYLGGAFGRTQLIGATWKI